MMLSRARDEQTWEVQPSLVPSFLYFLFYLFIFSLSFFIFLFSLFFLFFILIRVKKIFWEAVCVYIYFTHVLLRPLISITPIVAFNKLNLLYVMIDKKSKISQDAIDK